MCVILSNFVVLDQTAFQGHSSSLEPTRIDPPPMTSYLGSIATTGLSYRFRDKQRYRSKIANFPTTVYFAPPLKGFRLELGTSAWGQKTRMMTVEKVV